MSTLETGWPLQHYEIVINEEVAGLILVRGSINLDNYTVSYVHDRISFRIMPKGVKENMRGQASVKFLD